jgi:hypothetical protein
MLLRVNAAHLARAILILLCLASCGTASMTSDRDEDARRAAESGGGGGY